MDQTRTLPRTLLALLAAFALAVTAWLVATGLPGLADRDAGNTWHKKGGLAGNTWHAQPDVLAGNTWHVVQP